MKLRTVVSKSKHIKSTIDSRKTSFQKINLLLSQYFPSWFVILHFMQKGQFQHKRVVSLRTKVSCVHVHGYFVPSYFCYYFCYSWVGYWLYEEQEQKLSTLRHGTVCQSILQDSQFQCIWCKVSKPISGKCTHFSYDILYILL